MQLFVPSASTTNVAIRFENEERLEWPAPLGDEVRDQVGLALLKQLDDLLLFDVALEDDLAGSEAAFAILAGVFFANEGSTVLVDRTLALGTFADGFLFAEVDFLLVIVVCMLAALK